jgi:dTDP-4-dehydrorhamnose 3,5-epimerase
MRVTSADIPDIFMVEPAVFSDDRGFFMESFNQKQWEEMTGLKTRFVQDNHSRSTRGVLRGLHYQLPPSAQAKLVRCIVGEIYDVAVDIRRSSATFGQWFGCTLSAESKKQLWIPEGFAHGFQVLSDNAEILYKTTAYYDPESDRSILWNDPELGISWPTDTPPVLSAKDQTGRLFRQAELFD